MFFHTSAETVGMTKNGAITSTSSRLTAEEKKRLEKEAEEARLCQQSASMLVKLYRAQCPAKLPLLRELLKQQGLEAEAPAAK